MRFLVRLLAALLLAGAAHADVFNVGGASITIPAPRGFVNPAAQAPELAQALDQFVAPSNLQLGSFVAQADLAAVRQGRQPKLDRYFLAQTGRRANVMGVSEFATLRGLLRQQNAQLPASVNPQLNAALQSLNRDGGRSLSASLGQDGTATIEVHRDGDDAFGMLVVMNFEVTENGRTVKHLMLAGVVTTTVRNRLLYLNTYSPLRTTADLAWVRAQSLAWVKAVAAANS
jgi:hypothetical protein